MAFQVKFQDGRTATFQNRPTDQDIDDVAKQFGITPGQPPAGRAPEPKGVAGPGGFALGLGKELIGGTVGVARGLQRFGQRALAAVTPATLEEVRKTTGIKALEPTTPAGAGVAKALAPRGRAERAGAITGRIAEFAVPAGAVAIKGVKAVTGLARKRATGRLRETISPKLTAKERRLAIEQERVGAGRRVPGVFKAKDVITPRTDVVKAASTIERKIPGARRLNQFQLVGKLKSEITSVSKRLQPQLKKVPVSPQSRSQMVDRSLEVKRTQAKEPQFAAFAGSKRAQTNFQNIVTKAQKSKNLDELWQTRKEYDSLIKENVKKATSQSGENLQFQREMWIENRDILNDIIKQNSDGLPLTARRTFDDLNDFYTARENIISRAEIATRAEFPGRGILRFFGIGSF